MPNNQSHDPRVATAPERVAQAVALAVSAVASAGASGDIAWTGTIAHGSTLTITDAQSRFGTRTNVKPLYVNTGGGKADTALGRVTANKFPAAAFHQTTIKAGSVTGAVGLDHFNNSTDAAFENFDFDGSKPLINYTERYQAFDIADPAYQSADGFNLKTIRITGSDGNNLYVAWQGNEGSGSCRYFIEHIWSTGGHYYSVQQLPFEWFSDEFVLENSSLDTEDGVFEHHRNTQGALNSRITPETRDSNRPSPLNSMVFDQVSANTGQSSITYIGYVCIDDEYSGVYLGDAATRDACSNLVRQPQTAWSAGEVSIQLIESLVTVSSGYLYFRTGKNSWVSNDGVSLA